MLNASTLRQIASLFLLVTTLVFSQSCGKQSGEDRLVPSALDVVTLSEGVMAKAAYVRGSDGMFTTHDQVSGEALLWYSVSGSYHTLAASPGGVTVDSISAVERDGVIHLLAVDRKYRDIYYGRGLTSTLEWRNVFPGLDVVRQSVLTFDSADVPWIFFGNETSGGLWALQGDLSDDTFQALPLAAGLVGSIDAGVDANGRLQVVWARRGSNAALVLTSLNNGWHSASLWNGKVGGIALEIDPVTGSDLINSRPRVAWQDDGDGSLWYAQLLSGGWQQSQIAAGGRVGGDPAMIVDGNGAVRIVSNDHDLMDLVGIRWVPGQGWVRDTLAEDGATGLWPDIRLLPDGNYETLFYNYGANAVQKVIWREGW